MNKSKYIIAILSVIISLTACSLHHDDSGELGGYWHLTGVDTLATSGHRDVSDETIFWAVQFDLIQLKGADRQGVGREFYARFDRQDGHLTLYDIHEKNRSAGDPVVVADSLVVVHPYGIHEMVETFKTLRLDKHEMVLQSPMLRLTFRPLSGSST